MNTIITNENTYDGFEDFDPFNNGSWVLEVVKFITEPEVDWVKAKLYKIEGINFGSSNQTSEDGSI